MCFCLNVGMWPIWLLVLVDCYTLFMNLAGLNGMVQEKYKNKPWILEDETGQHQYHGQIEGSQSTTATYYLLMMQGKEFLAFPAGSWYNFGT